MLMEASLAHIYVEFFTLTKGNGPTPFCFSLVCQSDCTMKYENRRKILQILSKSFHIKYENAVSWAKFPESPYWSLRKWKFGQFTFVVEKNTS